MAKVDRVRVRNRTSHKGENKEIVGNERNSYIAFYVAKYEFSLVQFNSVWFA